MSKFLTKLKCEINNTLRYDYDGDVIGSVDKPIKLIDSLGENARRMLEIGIMQDRLVELGFKPFQEEEHGAEIMYFRLPIGNDESIEVNFNRTVEVGIGMFWCNDLTSESEFAYTSPTWQDDLINKVKGLIECNS